jgi:hypothetical protein
MRAFGTASGRTIAYLHEEVNFNKTADVRELGQIELGGIRTDIRAIVAEEWDTDEDFEANYNKRGALRATRHIIFRFCDRRVRPARCYDQPAWDRWAPLLLPVMAAAVTPYGYARGFYPRIMLARLPAGAFIAPHTDGDARGSRPHKIHVPILTNPDAYFFVNDGRYHFEEGRAYEVNNSTRHAAVNSGKTDRIHLIFEYLDADQQRFEKMGT